MWGLMVNRSRDFMRQATTWFPEQVLPPSLLHTFPFFIAGCPEIIFHELGFSIINREEEWCQCFFISPPRSIDFCHASPWFYVSVASKHGLFSGR